MTLKQNQGKILDIKISDEKRLKMYNLANKLLETLAYSKEFLNAV